MRREERLKVIIITRDYRIDGEITMAPNERLTDYLIDAKTFIAVTEAKVATLDGKKTLSAQFINVHRDHIEIILPAELITESS